MSEAAIMEELVAPEKPATLKKEKATDAEIADFFIYHITYPCEDLYGNNIRDYYIREALKLLPTFTDSDSKERLERIINLYSNISK